MLATLFRFALKINAIRQVPEGACGRCGGTGAGEDLADLGESFSRGWDLPVRHCKSCNGTGAAPARVAVTPFGILIPGAKTANAPVPVVAEVPISELISLTDAVGTNAQAIDPRQPDSTAANKRSAP